VWREGVWGREGEKEREGKRESEERERERETRASLEGGMCGCGIGRYISVVACVFYFYAF